MIRRAICRVFRHRDITFADGGSDIITIECIRCGRIKEFIK